MHFRYRSFQKVNDTYGHQVGDDVLVQLAQLLQIQVRLEDIVARYGGEEFIIILPETEIPAAKKSAKKLDTPWSRMVGQQAV